MESTTEEIYIIKNIQIILGRLWPSGYSVVDLETLAPHRCGLESCQGLWILLCDASFWNVGGSIQVPACA